MDTSRVYGYARVSGKDQNEGRQLEDLRKEVDERFIFIDHCGGKNFDRPQYHILMHGLRKGDLLIIKSIDRLGRNYVEIQNEWRRITKEIQAHIKVLDLPLLDTQVHKESLTDTFIADLVLQILAYVAEMERQNIKQRQSEGIALAKAQGKHLGRPCVQHPDAFGQIYDDWKSGKISGVAARTALCLKKNTFYKLVKQYEKQHPRTRETE